MSDSVLPQHLAVIMDGNRRWAEARFLPRQMGHRAGAKVARQLIELCARKKIPYLTLFAFGNENWRRSEQEVNTLLELFLENLEKELPTLQKNNIRLKIIGERERFDKTLQNKIKDSEDKTANNTGLQLQLAISYSGQWDICQAVRACAEKAQSGDLKIEDIQPELFQSYLSTGAIPTPELLIRTSGEKRISNFLLWQLAYTEFYFTEVLWPDFNNEEFEKALLYYQDRKRRFGS